MSVQMPPTNATGAPRRAMPIATLRQEPPTAGIKASRPSTLLAGTKSISASPQAISMSGSSGQPYREQALHRNDPDPAHARRLQRGDSTIGCRDKQWLATNTAFRISTGSMGDLPVD